jgi:hypothetical protein
MEITGDVPLDYLILTDHSKDVGLDDSSFMNYMNRELELVSVKVSDVLEGFPSKKEAKACCKEEVISADTLSSEAYFLQHFHEHLRQIAPTRRILTHIRKTRDNILTHIDLLPENLLNDPFIHDELKNIGTKKDQQHIHSYARTTSEVLLKGSFLYPVVHNLMKEADVTRQFLDEVSLYERKKKYQTNLTDRTLVRYAVEQLLQHFKVDAEEEEKLIA